MASLRVTAVNRDVGAGLGGEVIARARGGDDRAWESIFARFAGRLLVYVVHRLGPLGRYCTGEDIVQEVFLDAFKALRASEVDSDSIYPWLRRIADNRMRDLARRLSTEKRGGKEALVSVDFSDPYRLGEARARPWARSPTRPSVRAVRREDFERAVEALRRMEPGCARVFFMRWYEGLPVDEIARRLSITRTTVYTRLARAVREASSALEP
jgi:RNA polymerase sigma-70 factor (ECF subfamily)